MAEKILIIDKDEDFRSTLRGEFEKQGWYILEADQAKYGLALVVDKRPDLIVLDNDMPDMSGDHVIQKLKASKGLKDIPVIVVTSDAEQDKVLKFAKLGIKGYFVKPIKGNQLSTRVFSELKSRQNHDEMPSSEASVKHHTANAGGSPPIDTRNYFSVEDDIQYVHMPNKVTKRLMEAMEADFHPKIIEMTNKGIRKLILDLYKVETINIYLIKLTVTITQKCRALNYLFRAVSHPRLSKDLQQFSELDNIVFDDSVEKARKALSFR